MIETRLTGFVTELEESEAPHSVEMNNEQIEPNFIGALEPQESSCQGSVCTVSTSASDSPRETSRRDCNEVVLSSSDLKSDRSSSFTNSGLNNLKSPSVKEKKRELSEWCVIKNIVTFGIAFLALFTAFKGASNLQSSTNIDDGLGAFALTAYYTGFVFSSIFLPAVTIKWLGCKWTVAVSALAYVPYIASQFQPSFYTLIPGSVAAGLGAGPIWCASSTYISIVADSYAQISDLPAEVATSKLYGIFFMLYQLNQVSGNLISSTVLSMDSTTHNISSPSEFVCGASYCPGVGADEGNPNLQRPADSQFFVLTWIYLMCIAVAIIIVVFGTDSLQRFQGYTKEESREQVTGIALLAVTMKLLRHPYQLLLLPAMVFYGMEKAFLGAEYTAVYVSCSVGINNIGFIMICYGVTNSASSYLTSNLLKLCGRCAVMTGTVLFNIAMIVVLALWSPHGGDVVVLYILAAVWGALDGLWMVQINSLVSLWFPGKEEAAFSNYHLWESMGCIMSYAYSSTLCTHIKLYIMFFFLATGAMGFYSVEFLESRRQKQETSS